MTFFLTVLAVVGGFSLLLAWQPGGFTPSAPDGPELVVPAAEPGASRPLPRVNPTIDAASGTEAPPSGRGIVVMVEGPSPSGKPLGVAVLDGRDGRPLAFRSVDPEELPAEIELSGLPTGLHRVCLVRSAGHARFGYLDRAPVEVSAEHGARVTLSARVQDLLIQLVDSDDHERVTLVANTVHQLARVGDDDWRLLSALPASAAEPPSLMTNENGLLHLRDLGPGSYVLELSDLELEDGSSKFAFRVPGPGQLELICRAR